MAGRRISEDAVDAGLEPIEGSYVLAAEVHVHERRDCAALEQLPLERGIAPGDVLEDLAHGLAFSDHLALAADLGTQCGRDPDLGHACTPAQNST